MAAVSDCFTLGSTVWCRTCYDHEIEGEVLAFDPQTKILILKCGSSSGDPKKNDVNFINLALVKEMQVKKEVSAVPEVPQMLNLQKISNRIRNQVEEKKRLFTSMSSNASPEGQRLFSVINKVIKEVRWRDSDIVIFNNQVVISPPYQIENIRGNSNSREFTFILKVMEKHAKDLAAQYQQQQQQQQQPVIQHNNAATMQ